MVRRVDEPVAVRVSEEMAEVPAQMPEVADGPETDSGLAEDVVPTAFLWRGRLYVVREVLGHWRERCAWWTTTAARAVHGEGGFGADSGSGQELGQAGQQLEQTGQELAREREIWRVEASAGRSAGVGVYDLCRIDTRDTWQLLRIAD